MLEALVEVWSEELAQEGRIEVENFLVLEVKRVHRGEQAGALLIGGKLHRAPRVLKKLMVTEYVLEKTIEDWMTVR